MPLPPANTIPFIYEVSLFLFSRCSRSSSFSSGSSFSRFSRGSKLRFLQKSAKEMVEKIPHLAWKVWEMAVLRQALGLCDEIARLRMCAHRDVERHVARMARETLHQSSEGYHRVENEIGRLGLAHKDATLRVVGRVAHVDENCLKTRYVAKVGHLSTPNSCPRIAFETGKPW